MSEFPEYDWVQRSIDMTVSEAEEARDLSEKLKESGKIQKQYFSPEKLGKNSIETIFVELETKYGLTILEYKISQN